MIKNSIPNMSPIPSSGRASPDNPESFRRSEAHDLALKVSVYEKFIPDLQISDRKQLMDLTTKFMRNTDRENISDDLNLARQLIKKLWTLLIDESSPGASMKPSASTRSSFKNDASNTSSGEGYEVQGD